MSLRTSLDAPPGAASTEGQQTPPPGVALTSLGNCSSVPFTGAWFVSGATALLALGGERRTAGVGRCDAVGADGGRPPAPPPSALNCWTREPPPPDTLVVRVEVLDCTVMLAPPVEGLTLVVVTVLEYTEENGLFRLFVAVVVMAAVL